VTYILLIVYTVASGNHILTVAPVTVGPFEALAACQAAAEAVAKQPSKGGAVSMETNCLRVK